MQNIILKGIALLCLLSSCTKDLKPPDTDTLDTNAPVQSQWQLDDNFHAIAPPPYQYMSAYAQSAGGYIDTIAPIEGVSDYAAVLQAKIEEMERHAGATLYIMPGTYSVNSCVTITLYARGYANQRLNIIGISDAAGNAPLISTAATQPHMFFYFNSAPDDNAQELNIDNLRIEGNNVPYSASHPFYGASASPAPAIRIASINKSTVNNCIIKNVYGDGVQVVNWASVYLSEYNLNEYSKVRNVHIIDCWSNNLSHDSGDGIMMYHVGHPEISDCVISNSFSLQQTYGRGGIVLEGGTRDATIQNSFIQGYRSGIICEQDLGGHTIAKNAFIKNKYNSITFAHDLARVNATPQSLFHPTKISDNVFMYNQRYLEWGANQFGQIVLGDFSYALNGMLIQNNTFMVHEENTPSEKSSWADTTLTNPYNMYIQKWGATGIQITNNAYHNY